MRKLKVKEICDLQNGKAFKPSDWTSEGLPIIRIQNLNDETKPFNYCDGEVEEKYHIKNGDLLFSWSGTPGTSFGAFIWNRGEAYLNQHIYRVDIKNGTDTKFFKYVLNSKLREIIDQSHGGVGLKHITKKKLEKIEIPLPNLDEQKAIVAKLDRAQRLIEIDNEMLAIYDKLIQSVFLEMFGDPVTNPKGWEIKKLGEVGTLARGKSKHRPRNDPSILGGKYPLIQTGDVSNAGLFITDYDSTYNEQGLKQSKLWEKGTLCITIAANIAKVGILDFNACFPDSVVGFKSEQASSIFIYSWMGFLQDIIEEQAPVSAQKNINLRILRDLDIIFPPLELQSKYESAVLSIHSEREKVTEMNKKSEELFSSLVQEAFN